MYNKIEAMNNKIIALSIMIQDRMATREDLKENTTIDDDVKKIIYERLIYEIQSLSKQMRKEYSNIQTNAINTKRFIRAFESTVF
jgi:hypothetical protein